MKSYNLTFEKENNGYWYIVLPNWPFSHNNLMMVKGADKLCEYIAQEQNTIGKAAVTVTVNDNLLDGNNPDIKMSRFSLGYGASYNVTLKDGTVPDFKGKDIDTAWLCPVTLFVFGRYPKQINIYAA